MINQILYTAIVTPFDASGDTVDFSSLEKLIRQQEEAGNGIVLLGSTGESLSLSRDERLKIVQFVCDLNFKNELVVGVPSYNLKEALDWIDICNPFPIQGYLMTTPIYTKPGIMGQTQWFETLLNASSHPAILYNIPGRSAIKLHPESVSKLSIHKKCAAIKDSGGTIDSLVDYAIAAPHIALYCGDDYLMPSMAAEGAVGLISVASNVWGKETRCYVKQALEGIKHQDKLWWQACKALFSASNPIPVKALLKELGMIQYDTVRLPLSRDDLFSLEPLLSYNTMIQSWYNALSATEGERRHG